MNQELALKIAHAKANLLLARPDNKILQAICKKELLNSGDLLIIFCITPKTFYSWMKKRKLEERRVTNRYYFYWSDLEPLL